MLTQLFSGDYSEHIKLLYFWKRQEITCIEANRENVLSH